MAHSESPKVTAVELLERNDSRGNAEEKRDQDMAHFKTQLELITNYLTTLNKLKVHTVNAQDKGPRYDDHFPEFEEEENFINYRTWATPKGLTKTLGVKIKEIKVGTTIGTMDMIELWVRDRDQGQWRKWRGPKNDGGGVYVPLWSKRTCCE
ncbi:hypothetical protein HAX54_033720 [Datura stramonium]|uniref:Uncharacterized protein n=1 Tax=Datura stramonium TaxID=4076 RepID=A0ABS8VFL0_DATST|nr:hypothetical protein [Datura stramonium]